MHEEFKRLFEVKQILQKWENKKLSIEEELLMARMLHYHALLRRINEDLKYGKTYDYCMELAKKEQEDFVTEIQKDLDGRPWCGSP